MKYDDVFSILKAALNAANDKSALNGKISLRELFQYSSDSDTEINTNNTMLDTSENNHKNNSEVYDEYINIVDNSSYNDESTDYSNKSSTVLKDQQLIINPITDALTPIKLQQAVILSEVIGKPRSKTRRKKRF